MSTIAWVGVDPGKEAAALGVICGDTVQSLRLPKSTQGQALAIAHCLTEWGQRGCTPILITEEVNSFGMGRQSAFVFGRYMQLVQTVCDVLGVAYHPVTPSKWKADLFGAELKACTTDKEKKLLSVRKRRQWLPNAVMEREDHDGEAEALLLAYWGIGHVPHIT
jgi:hypothetical protein